jgi:hypothetical protein
MSHRRLEERNACVMLTRYQTKKLSVHRIRDVWIAHRTTICAGLCWKHMRPHVTNLKATLRLPCVRGTSCTVRNTARASDKIRREKKKNKKISSETGLEPARANPLDIGAKEILDIRVKRLNHSAILTADGGWHLAACLIVVNHHSVPCVIE